MARSAGVMAAYLRSGWCARCLNAIAFAVAASLLFAPPVVAAETVVAGGVSSGSTNLWPIHIGIRKGFFQAAGIDVDLVFAQSNASVIQQLAANSINVSVGSGLVDPIRAVEKGAPVAVIRIETQKPPYALLARPALKSIADLKGKTVSVGGPKDITRIFFERMLAASGAPAGSVDLIFAGATSARMAALESGAADAALLTTPYNFHAEAAGYRNLGMTAEMVDMPFSGVSINRNWAGRNMKTAQAYLTVYSQAIQWLDNPANRREAIDIMLAVSSLKPEDVEKSYDFLLGGHFFETTGTISRAQLGKVLEALQELGDIPPTMPVDSLFLPGLTQVSD
ncbi:MAG TPA: ABC transporter substrate-binding protein [Xanthobacteraceae bacterium]|nr:ABC transporter substrate-binding protein [Xanthobacteraceae bacterium]